MTRKRKQPYNTIVIRGNISRELQAAKAITEGYEEPPSSNPGNAFLNLMTSHTLIALSKRRRILPNSSFTYAGQNIAYHIWNIKPNDPALEMLPATQAKRIRCLRKHFTAAFYAKNDWHIKTTRVFESAFLSIVAITEVLIDIEILNGQKHPLFCTHGFTQMTDKIYRDLCLLRPCPLSKRITELIRIKDVKRFRDKFANYRLLSDTTDLPVSELSDDGPEFSPLPIPASSSTLDLSRNEPFSTTRRQSLARQAKQKVATYRYSSASDSETEVLTSTTELSPSGSLNNHLIASSLKLTPSPTAKLAFVTTQDVEDRRLTATDRPITLPLDFHRDSHPTESEAEDIFEDFNSPDARRKMRACLTALLIKYNHIKEFVLDHHDAIDTLQVTLLHEIITRQFTSPSGTHEIPVLHIAIQFGNRANENSFVQELEEALSSPTYFFPYDYVTSFLLDGAPLTIV